MVAAALGRVLLLRGNLAEARPQLMEALAYARRSRDVPIIAEVVATWSAYLLADGRPEQAARVLGASCGVRGLPMAPRGDADDLAEQLRAVTPSYDAAFAEGAELDREAAGPTLLGWLDLSADELDALAQDARV